MNFKTLILSLLVCLISCQTAPSDDDNVKKTEEEVIEEIINDKTFSADYFNEDDFIIYEDLGQPLPPSFYKKYQFKVNLNEIVLNISNYKETLYEEKRPISEAELSDIVEKLKSMDIKECDTKDSAGCTGGHTENLNYKVGIYAFSGNAFSCGANQYGNICGKPSRFGNYLKDYFPKFEISFNK